MLAELKRAVRRWVKPPGKSGEGPQSTAGDLWPTTIIRALANLRERLAAEATEENLFLDYCRQHAHVSKAQIFQDLFVLFRTEEKRSGFFVEFGAGNGVELSNTHLLESQFGWSGILAEPAQSWHAALRVERRCSIDHRCVWSRSGDQLEFNEAGKPEYSTVARYSSMDMHSTIRNDGRCYLVETVTLNDLLKEHGAPEYIDYLSIDTEGSELEILKAFDFRRYQVRLITVEHNFKKDRDDMYRLLRENGFVRKFEGIASVDDWYENPTVVCSGR